MAIVDIQEYLKLIPAVNRAPQHAVWLTYDAEAREGFGNSDSVISGSLASPTPPEGGDTKERGNETHETESRSHL